MRGSSPRTRGTLVETGGVRPVERFIPAHAGNAERMTSVARPITVHPRARGERRFGGAITYTHRGSSPRTRGTPADLELACEVVRFIPAHSGNAARAARAGSCAAVHPRARGERLIPAPRPATSRGSSPRTRGTQVQPLPRARHARFIPAHAGNAPPSTGPSPRAPVHPRARGERDRMLAARHSSDGSSPRTRGTPDERAAGLRSARFIPAHAGNAPAPPPRRASATVHPRARGERAHEPSRPVCVSGSSPRTRGTRLRSLDERLCGRFIPAHAGNARRRRATPGRRTVHPRARGERAAATPPPWLVTGSSPRTRGTLAGEAPGVRAVLVHPRARGERTASTTISGACSGSSPRTRGTRRAAQHRQHRRRFIPAHAGNAAGSRAPTRRRTVHPRARGERTPSGSRIARSGGSSPRTRGTPIGCYQHPVGPRFIPAHAGNA